jgi:hypothetical protein
MMDSIEFTNNNTEYRRVTEFTVDEWNGTEWVTIVDYTPEDEWQDNPADLDDVVDRMMTDPKFYDDIVGWF